MESCLCSSIKSEICTKGILNNFFSTVGFHFFPILLELVFLRWLYHSKTKKIRYQWKQCTIQTISNAIESHHRRYRAHNSLIRTDFRAHNNLIRSNFKRTIVWTMVWCWSGPWLHICMDNDLFSVCSAVISVWQGYDQIQLWAHSERTRCFTCLQSDQWAICFGMVW